MNKVQFSGGKVQIFAINALGFSSFSYFFLANLCAIKDAAELIRNQTIKSNRKSASENQRGGLKPYTCPA